MNKYTVTFGDSFGGDTYTLEIEANYYTTNATNGAGLVADFYDKSQNHPIASFGNVHFVWKVTEETQDKSSEPHQDDRKSLFLDSRLRPVSPVCLFPPGRERPNYLIWLDPARGVESVADQRRLLCPSG